MQRPSYSSSRIKVSTARGAIAATLLVLAACGGSSTAPTLTLSGTVSGLTSSGMALTSAGINLDVSAGATSFTFGAVLSDQVGYNVSVAIQPTGQICTVTNGSGVAATANITNVVVTCSNRTFNVGGTISGLSASGLVLANGSDTLSVPEGATSFTLPTAVAYGSSYAVTVAAQPTGLTCDVTNGTGTIGAAAVTNVTIACKGAAPTISGSISGLGSATGLVLVNGTDEYSVPASATNFTLAAQPSGSAYAVRVQSQPAGMTCSVSDGAGTMPTHDITAVSIACSDQAYSLGGTLVGLTAGGLVLSDGAESYNVPAHANSFTMPTAVAYGSAYSVSIETQPSGLTCTVSGARGTMPANAVMDVAVTCATSGYTLGGSISGLTKSGLVLTDDTDDLSVAANAAQFSMPNAVAEGSRYTVAVKVQPSGEVCEVSDGTGTVAGEVGTVRITCAAAER